MHTQFSKLCQETTLYKAWNYVKSKGSAGGIDGVTIETFNKDKIRQIKIIQEELKNGTWKPQPYLQIAIPKRKDPSENRILGMAVVKDKIIQQAIRQVIEPRFERIFLSNSYAYRPGKGALKTIRYIVKQCDNNEYHYALRLDIDNFFDEIDHDILKKRLTAIGIEDEIIRLVKLMESIGTRMNYSVFECMLAEIQYKNMCKRLTKLVIKKEDWINIYPLCTECYARIEYIPPIKKKEPIKIAIV